MAKPLARLQYNGLQGKFNGWLSSVLQCKEGELCSGHLSRVCTSIRWFTEQ